MLSRFSRSEMECGDLERNFRPTEALELKMLEFDLGVLAGAWARLFSL